jgi:tetratricopeptide (TPR) repeat protein
MLRIVSQAGAGWALRSGQRALAAGELEQAKEQLARAAAARPRWVPARLWLASALSEAGELDAARAELDAAIERAPDSSIPRLWLGRILLDHDLAAEARDALEEASRRDLENAQIKGFLALARWVAGGEDAVLEALGWSLPNDGGELRGRWLLELERRFPGGPGADFSTPPRGPRWPTQRLARWRSRRLVERAARALERHDPLAALSLIDRAEAHWFGEDRVQELRIRAHRDAAAIRREQLAAEPHDVELRLATAEDLLAIGEPREALRALEPAAEHIRSIDPNRLSWRASEALLRGRALLATDAPDPAREALELARELWPTEVEPVYYLAIARLRGGARAAARRDFVEACTLDGGLAQARLDEYREASAGFQE